MNKHGGRESAGSPPFSAARRYDSSGCRQTDRRTGRQMLRGKADAGDEREAVSGGVCPTETHIHTHTLIQSLSSALVGMTFVLLRPEEDNYYICADMHVSEQ